MRTHTRGIQGDTQSLDIGSDSVGSSDALSVRGAILQCVLATWNPSRSLTLRLKV